MQGDMIMEKAQRFCIILDLIEDLKNNGSWCGETHIQKAVYFLQEVGLVPTDLEFILYKHGPFSFDLRDELTAMRATGLIEIKVNQYPYGPSIAITDMGKMLQKRLSMTVSQYRKNISYISTQLGSKGVAELERLATALFVKETEGITNKVAAAAKIHSIKPHIPIDIAMAAFEASMEIKSNFQPTKN